MIDYLRGTLAEKEITHITIEAHGVGYGVSIPLSTYEKLPALGEAVMVHIHYYVREDAHKLFGFSSKTEREMFQHLIGITKIGPKVALNLLSGIALKDLVMSVTSGDPSRLEKIPGVGARTAQRLVLELKGKLGSMGAMDGIAAGSLAVRTSRGALSTTGARDEAFAAMIALGYNEKQVVKAIARVEQESCSDDSVEVWIRKALQVI